MSMFLPPSPPLRAPRSAQRRRPLNLARGEEFLLQRGDRVLAPRGRVAQLPVAGVQLGVLDLLHQVVPAPVSASSAVNQRAEGSNGNGAQPTTNMIKKKRANANAA